MMHQPKSTSILYDILISKAEPSGAPASPLLAFSSLVSERAADCWAANARVTVDSVRSMQYPKNSPPVAEVRFQDEAMPYGNIGVGLFKFDDGSSCRISAYSQARRNRIEKDEAAFKGCTCDDGQDFRKCDSEFQILNHFRSSSGCQPKVPFEVVLFTERPPCHSCTKVVNEFLKFYTSATIKIRYSFDRLGERASIAHDSWLSDTLSGRSEKLSETDSAPTSTAVE